MGLAELVNDDEHVVFNRNGHIITDSEGRVRSVFVDEHIEDCTGHFKYITRVDLQEWRAHWSASAPKELDILDVAYWFRLPQADEIYQPADTAHRTEVAAWKRRRAVDDPT